MVAMRHACNRGGRAVCKDVKNWIEPIELIAKSDVVGPVAILPEGHDKLISGRVGQRLVCVSLCVSVVKFF
jgi:hypothetical protein